MSNITVKSYNGKFFDLYDKDHLIFITDYHMLDKEFILYEDEMRVEIGGKKEKKILTSIDELRDVFAELIEAATVILQPFGFDVSPLNKGLLIDQLIFDILFEKYLCEAEKMTRSGYSKYISKILISDDILYHENTNKAIERSMRQYHDMLMHSELKEQLEQIGVVPGQYSKYYTPIMRDNISKKKPKIIWDFLFYNHSKDLNLLYRQYRRQLNKDDRNYSYEEFILDLNNYMNFVNRLLPEKNEEPYNYFKKTMDYYFLESYKRIDFIFKLIDKMPENVIKKVDKEHFLVKRFHPYVLQPVEDEGDLDYNVTVKYYRPLFWIEDKLHDQIKNFNIPDESHESSEDENEINLETLLFNYQLIRAKVYELFCYHAEYRSSNYSDIKNFISNHFDMRFYHESNKIWQMIAGKNWNQMEMETKREFKIIANKFFSVNEALFWESSERNITSENE